jgi:hypothetical protein
MYGEEQLLENSPLQGPQRPDCRPEKGETFFTSRVALQGSRLFVGETAQEEAFNLL